jgi:hypothetical protein
MSLLSQNYYSSCSLFQIKIYNRSVAEIMKMCGVEVDQANFSIGYINLLQLLSSNEPKRTIVIKEQAYIDRDFKMLLRKSYNICASGRKIGKIFLLLKM